MVKIAHILNVTEINDSKKSSYLHVAQPVTMRSMVIAQRIAKKVVDVDLFAVKHKDETVSVPDEFSWTADLEKYAWEYVEPLKDLPTKRPMPRIQDIVQSLYNSSDAEYFIYTNLDIGLYPDFYLAVSNFITQGYDSFCINRRDLPKMMSGVLLDESNIELMFSMVGADHPGVDCFVFKRSIVPSLDLGNVFIGYPPVGQVLKSQIEEYSNNCLWVKDRKLTFHIGSDKPWKNTEDMYYQENKKQSEGLFKKHFKKPE